MMGGDEGVKGRKKGGVGDADRGGSVRDEVGAISEESEAEDITVEGWLFPFYFFFLFSLYGKKE